MNDIIKLILFNLLLFWVLKYDKRYSIPIIVVMIIYWITIQSSIRTKIVEGNSFFEDFVKLPDFSDYDYSTQLPNSILHNSQDQGYSSVFSFFNGGGKYSTLKNDRMSTLEETNSLLDQLIGMFEMGQENCKGGFEKLTECSRDCGYGTHEKVYRVIQEKGPNGIDCPYTDGHTIKQMCILRDCNVDEKCRNNYECRSGNCDNGTCKRVGECDEDTLYHCYTRRECLGLNKKYENYGGRYEWDSRTNTCSFESKPRVETNIYDGNNSDDGDNGSGDNGVNPVSGIKYKCDEGYCKPCDENENSDNCLYNDDNCDGKCNKCNGSLVPSGSIYHNKCRDINSKSACPNYFQKDENGMHRQCYFKEGSTCLPDENKTCIEPSSSSPPPPGSASAPASEKVGSCNNRVELCSNSGDTSSCEAVSNGKSLCENYSNNFNKKCNDVFSMGGYACTISDPGNPNSACEKDFKCEL
jgi:hypothetical protein